MRVCVLMGMWGRGRGRGGLIRWCRRLRGLIWTVSVSYSSLITGVCETSRPVLILLVPPPRGSPESRAFAKYEHVKSGNDPASFAVPDSELPPRPFPVQALDHAAGYLLAYAVQVALLRRSVEGGSYTIKVSLVQTAKWLRTMGRVKDPMVAF